MGRRAERGDHGRESRPELRGATGKAGLTCGVGLSVTEWSNGAGGHGAWERVLTRGPRQPEEKRHARALGNAADRWAIPVSRTRARRGLARRGEN